MGKRVRVGCASGFWGDSALAVPQLLTVPQLQYLVFDYLAETTMAILQKARMKDPDLGYATDFVTAVIEPHLGRCMAQGVRLVANAGGLNPQSCRDAVRAAAAKAGLSPKIAVVSGDDILQEVMQGRVQTHDTRSPEIAHARLLSANAYLGAAPIAAALAAGADIVITGRCVDSAVTLGIAAFEFGWRWDEWDKLAQASLAGHLIECGPQATGGLFTDWESVPDWDNIGYPYVDLHEDGSFELAKPEATGGLVRPEVVAEQLVYEIEDPARYLLPDVVCDFRQVTIAACGADRVRICGARGTPSTPFYKVCATYRDGYQIQILMAIRGLRAAAKAARTAESLLARSRRQMQEGGFPDYTGICIEQLGQDSQYPQAHPRSGSREIVLRIAAHHPSAAALAFLQKESTTAGSSMGPGTRSNFGGRARIQPVVKLQSFLVDKGVVPVTVDCDAVRVPVPSQAHGAVTARGAGHEAPANPFGAAAGDAARCVQVLLEQVAWARSGDKGDDVNIGVIARRPELAPWIAEALSSGRVHQLFAHRVEGNVERYSLPGVHALNFVLRQALGGGGTASLRSDPLGKSFAQILLETPVQVPPELVPPTSPRAEAGR